jgi:hypothetical protein
MHNNVHSIVQQYISTPCEGGFFTGFRSLVGFLHEELVHILEQYSQDILHFRHTNNYQT